MNAMDQVAGNARVAKNRSAMTQEEINRRCGVSKAMGDRERLARQILEERKRKAQAEIREMEEKAEERQLDIEAIDARLAGGEVSSAIVEGILQSHEAEENAENNKGENTVTLD
jgi:bacterioferritin-associated ferredoxin